MENPIKMDDLGVPTPIYGNTHVFRGRCVTLREGSLPLALIPIVDLQVPAKPVAEKKNPSTGNP